MLAYLEIKKENDAEIVEEISMPNIKGLSIKEAEKTLKESGLEIEIEGNAEGTLEVVDKENTFVKEQIPSEGIKVNKGSRVIVRY